MIYFCFDTMIDANTVWPNCIDGKAASREKLVAERAQWSTREPFVDYPRILDYLRDESVPYQTVPIELAPRGSLYAININWFDHHFDYFDQMSDTAKNLVTKGLIKIVMFYSEGDNPMLIQKTLFQLCQKHNFSPTNIHFVIANTAADLLPNFYYFDDDEIIFQRSQKDLPRLVWHDQERSRRMTLLSRIHKKWRAEFCAKYWGMGFHYYSWFSYHNISFSDDESPLRKHNSTLTKEFLSVCPFEADQLRDSQRNFYGSRIDAHFNDSYWNCVLETHLNFEHNIPGIFVSEKTWKPIANAQPFVILGCNGTLRHLRDHGYETFAQWINEDYDLIADPTYRFDAVWNVILDIHSWSSTRMHQTHLSMREVVEHNQRLYWQSKQAKLQALFDRIINDRL